MRKSRRPRIDELRVGVVGAALLELARAAVGHPARLQGVVDDHVLDLVRASVVAMDRREQLAVTGKAAEAVAVDRAAGLRRRAGARQVARAAVHRDHVAHRHGAVAIGVHLHAEALVVVEPVAGDAHPDRVTAVETVVVVVVRLRPAGVRLGVLHPHPGQLAVVGADVNALDPVAAVVALGQVDVDQRRVVCGHVHHLVARAAAAGRPVAALDPYVLERGAGVVEGDVADQHRGLLGPVGLALRREGRPRGDAVHLSDVLRPAAEAEHLAGGRRARVGRVDEVGERLAGGLDVVAARLGRDRAPARAVEPAGAVDRRDVAARGGGVEVAAPSYVDEHPVLVGRVGLEAGGAVRERHHPVRAVDLDAPAAGPGPRAELAPLPGPTAVDVGAAAQDAVESAGRGCDRGGRVGLRRTTGERCGREDGRDNDSTTGASPPAPKHRADPIGLHNSRALLLRPVAQVIDVLVRQPLGGAGLDEQRGR